MENGPEIIQTEADNTTNKRKLTEENESMIENEGGKKSKRKRGQNKVIFIYFFTGNQYNYKRITLVCLTFVETSHL